jgi:hypothetical protein
MNRLLREPLIHFLVIGALLFGLDGLTQSGRPATTPSTEIRLSLDEIAQLTLLHQSQWHRPPTPQELAQMVENKVRQEVLYREALAMGLDKDDEIVKRRMAQKMQFLPRTWRLRASPRVTSSASGSKGTATSSRCRAG